MRSAGTGNAQKAASQLRSPTLFFAVWNQLLCSGRADRSCSDVLQISRKQKMFVKVRFDKTGGLECGQRSVTCQSGRSRRKRRCLPATSDDLRDDMAAALSCQMWAEPKLLSCQNIFFCEFDFGRHAFRVVLQPNFLPFRPTCKGLNSTLKSC